MAQLMNSHAKITFDLNILILIRPGQEQSNEIAHPFLYYAVRLSDDTRQTDPI